MPHPRHKPKPTIYLAGPISGCNPDQISRWRLRTRDRWSSEFEFLDPAEDVEEARSAVDSYEIVHRDATAIERADAVLAHMWKESIGTAIGVAIARMKGKPVVVADPNRIQSRILAYYADAVEETVDGAMRALKGILRAERTLRRVVKSSGTEEGFLRKKLADALRRACRTAERDDLLAPAEIVPRVLEVLLTKRGPAADTVTTRQIRNAVWSVLSDLEADPLRRRDFDGIRAAWETYDSKRRAAPVPRADEGTVEIHDAPQRARVFSGKSHGTIWGKAVKRLSDVPREAREVFREILRVDGIAEIRITTRGSGPKTPGARVEIHASKDRGVLEGKLFHPAKHGQVQMFQIVVHDDARKDAIRVRLLDHLAAVALLRVGEKGDIPV